MNPLILALLTIRASALAATVAGRPSTGKALYTLADLIEAGRATEAHMTEVATKLANQELTEADWVDVRTRIEADAARLHSG